MKRWNTPWLCRRCRPGSLSTWKPITAGWSAYRATTFRMIRSAWKRNAGCVMSTSCRAPQPMRSPVRASPVISGYWRASHGGTAYVGVPRITEMPRSCAPSSTGWSQSRSNRPFSGSQVDHTDSPIRMTVKRASAIRSRSSFSRSWGWYSW